MKFTNILYCNLQVCEFSLHAYGRRSRISSDMNTYLKEVEILKDKRKKEKEKNWSVKGKKLRDSMAEFYFSDFTRSMLQWI